MKLLDNIALDSIEVGERFRKDLGDVDALVNSIRELDLATPITVKQKPDGGYLLIAGERRLRACIELKRETIPAHIYPADTNDYQLRALELAENLERKDMTWQERCNLIAEIHSLWTAMYGEAKGKQSGGLDKSGHRIQDTADMIGVSRNVVGQGLILHEASKVFPELAKCKTQDEANKMFRNIRTASDRREAASAIVENVKKGGVDSFRSNLISNYIISDAFEQMDKLPAESYDFLEVDPPYGIDLQAQKKLNGGSTLDLNASAYNEVDRDSYIAFLNQLCERMYRVMSPNSWAVLWYGIKPWHATILDTFGKKFDVCEIPAIWVKSQGQCSNPDIYMANSYETFFYMRKGRPNLYRQGRLNSFIYKQINPKKKMHPTEKPIELLEDILSVFCWEGTRLLVPFLGSGNTLLAAANMNIVGAGFDLSQQYKDAFITKVMESEPGLYKSYEEMI